MRVNELLRRRFIKYLAWLACALTPVAYAGEHPSTFRNFLGMEFVPIKAGSFLMGSPENELGREIDENQHTVTISQDFYIQTTEVTRKQWKELMVGDPSPFKACGDDCPVSRVQWDWIDLFLQKLNDQSEDYHYRLPTEAEWEYAARAGNTGPFTTGNCLPELSANFRADMPYGDCQGGLRSKSPSPVASYAPNAWGIYDIHGNVWELCSDWYGAYPTEETVDPAGPESGKYRVVRGGSWFNAAEFARVANRHRALRNNYGFRLVAIPKPKPTVKLP